MSDPAPPALVRQVIYFSESRIEGGPAAVGAALSAILDSSRRRNAEAGLTGALMLSGSRFVQLLEGPGAALSEVLARIHADARHAAVVTTTDFPAATRIFGDWSMAYAGEAGQPDIPLTLSLASADLTLAQERALGHLRALAQG